MMEYVIEKREGTAVIYWDGEGGWGPLAFAMRYLGHEGERACKWLRSGQRAYASHGQRAPGTVSLVPYVETSPVLASFFDCVQRLDNLVTIDAGLHPDHPNKMKDEQWQHVRQALDAARDRMRQPK